MTKSQELFIDGYEWPDEVVVYLVNDEWVGGCLYLKETEFLEMGVQYSNEQYALETENAKLRELVRGLHMAYVGALNECEGMDAGLIWNHCEMVDAELAKSHARFETDRHRFDVDMRELGIEVE